MALRRPVPRVRPAGSRMTARYDGDIPGWGGLARNDRADPRRLRRRRPLRRVHLQRRRLVDALPRDVPLHRRRHLPTSTATTATCPAGAAWPGTTSSSPPTSTATGACDLWVVEPRGLVDGVPRPDDLARAPPARPTSSATGWASGTSARPTRSRSARFDGETGQPQLYVHNTDWFGVINGRRGIASTASTTAGSTPTATAGTGEGAIMQTNRPRPGPGVRWQCPSTTRCRASRRPRRKARPRRPRRTSSGAKKTDKPPTRKARQAGPDKPAAWKGAAAAREPGRRRSSETRSASSDDQPAAGRPEGQQYIRLRIRVRGDRLTVVDSHLVDGPLGQTQVLRGAQRLRGHARRPAAPRRARCRISACSGRSSTPGPEGGPAGALRHRAPDLQFTARVAAARGDSRDDRSAITLRLHRIKEEARADAARPRAAGPAVPAGGAAGR